MKRYWKCYKCGNIGFTSGRLVDTPPSTMCLNTNILRTSGICGGAYTIEVTEKEYNEFLSLAKT